MATTKKRKRRRLVVQPLECRRVLTASLGWDGPGQGSAELTYYIANSPPSLTQTETDAAIETALSAWEEVIDVTFTRVNTPGLRDSIDISFTEIDGGGGTLAQAYFPDDVNPARIAGDIEFDLAEIWEVGNELGRQAFDLVWVAAHELGHSLGLEHTDSVGSVLAPFVSPNQSFVSLSSEDIAAATEVYAAAGAGVDFAVDDTTTDVDLDEESTDDNPQETDQPDNENDPFPRRRWRRGGQFRRWGGRLDAELVEHNYRNPTDTNSDGITSLRDALLVINQLGQEVDGSEMETDLVGLCDSNGDGDVTPSDALTIINTLDSESQETSANDREATSLANDNEGDEVDIENQPSDVDEPSGNDESMIDDGGLTDDGEVVDDTEGELTGDDDRDDSFRDGSNPRRFLTLDADELIANRDEDGDNLLSADELPNRIWSTMVELNVDTDQDGLLSAEEITTFVSTLREEYFELKDLDEDGLLVEEEVGDFAWMRLTAADLDVDAAVSFSEFDAWLDSQESRFGIEGNRFRRAFELRLATLQVDELFSERDTDGDGLLAQGELSSRMWRKLIAEEVDSDSNGLLSVEEIVQVVENKQREVFDLRDEDRDGQLVETEVGEKFWNKVSEADVDSDSALTFTEFRDWLDSGEATFGSARVKPVQLMRMRGQRHHHHEMEVPSTPAAADMVFASFGRRIGGL